MFKYSKAITAKKIRSCTSNTTLLADDSQNCVSLEHLMITSKKPNFHNQPWFPMYSKMKYNGNPFLYPVMQSESIQLFPLNNSQTRSQTSTIFEKFNVSFTIINFFPPLIIGWTIFFFFKQFNCRLFSQRGRRRKIIPKSLPCSPMPLQVAQVGNLENIICDLNEVTRRIHQNKTSSEH